ncbi:hypothetical protein M8542_36275 [Amycolatopsis sp. OK19-0408]|uniref:Uncharacterized protein n=1 Tax=Amycolatopsis iheyensis TaxID=2945988 RepID=A0A9X2SMY2_9PSEU|nr:hypothetical protein [Amycolatopsis iheyensis]MCR6488302.1 hypothetical protein [Amycolatopsis iheyensis]
MATGISERLIVLHQARFPSPGRITEASLAAMLAVEMGVDVDTMKVVVRPGPRLAPWSRYEAALAALGADQEVTEWFSAAHDALSEVFPAWRPPPRDIADITTAAEFMATLRRVRETPRAISVSALARDMCSRDSKNAWRRTQLGHILDAANLPPAGKEASVRNLLKALCENARRPPADVDHFLDAWHRLQPASAPIRQATTVAPLWPLPEARRDDEVEAPVVPAGSWPPAVKTLIAVCLILVIVIVVVAAVL